MLHTIASLYSHLACPTPHTCSVCHAVKEDPAVLDTSEAHIVALFDADHRYQLQGDWVTDSLFSNGFVAVPLPIRVLVNRPHTRLAEEEGFTALEIRILFATAMAAMSGSPSTNSTFGILWH